MEATTRTRRDRAILPRMLKNIIVNPASESNENRIQVYRVQHLMPIGVQQDGDV